MRPSNRGVMPHGLSLDLKLGFRMLVKYPGLAVVGGLAMAISIWFGAVTFQMFGVITSTSRDRQSAAAIRYATDAGHQAKPSC